MKFLPPHDPITLYETGFNEKDILQRKKTSKSLSDLLDNIEDPLVVALDGAWGTGESYFLKRWVADHKNNGGRATTIYFDAFAQDYLNDPLVSLIGAIGEKIPSEAKSKWQKIRNAAATAAQPVTKVGLALATAGISTAVDGFIEASADKIFNAGVSATKDQTEKALDSFWKREEGRRRAMEDFRSSLLKLISPSEAGKATPLIIVIDELDRCRPDYALELLEIIKHFFSVDGIHFVLGVNTKALEQSVKQRYGSDFDAHGYLKRFINLTLQLPDTIGPNRHQQKRVVVEYAKHTAKAMGLWEPVGQSITEHLDVVARANSISIRDVGKIMSLIALLPEEAKKTNIYEGWRTALSFMLVSSVIRPEIYEKVTRFTLQEPELRTYLGAYPSEIDREINEEHNPNYKQDTFWQYITILHLITNGRGTEDCRRDLNRTFSGLSHEMDAKNVIETIQSEWLEVFKMN